MWFEVWMYWAFTPCSALRLMYFWERYAQFGAEPDEEKYIHRHPGAHPKLVDWLLEKKIQGRRGGVLPGT